jgi:hypothetical protein
VNLCDLCAVAVPAGEVDSGLFGVTLVAPAFHDAVLADLARRFADGQNATEIPRTVDSRGTAPSSWGPPGVELAVFGAHMTGQPLNGQLSRMGARLLGDITTAPEYRMRALPTVPAKPGLVRVTTDGRRVRGERWLLSAAALASLVAQLVEPMTLGRVRLEDGDSVIGFLCEPIVADAGEDISGPITNDITDWRDHVRQTI